VWFFPSFLRPLFCLTSYNVFFFFFFFVLPSQYNRSASSVGKLKCLLELMSLRMSDIVAEWESGTLKRRGLTRDEVSVLIEALFSDSQLRRQVLERVNGGG
jgi:hypothetical protein